MNETAWVQRFTDMGAFWMHDGNPKRPHALLTSGNHSNGFFNGSIVIRKPGILHMACNDFFCGIRALNLPPVGIVIGSAHGATLIAYEIAQKLGRDVGFTEPVIVGGEKNMILKRFPINQDHPNVLVVEDVMTTGNTTRMSIAAIEAAGGKVVNQLFVLVNRSGMSELDGRKIIAIIDREMPIWTPNECPLCKQGSEAIRPKGNWDRLTGHYEEEKC